MMPPGHIAATWGVAAVLQQHNPRLARLDFRLLALSALAADLIDKPLALSVFTEAQTSQLMAHSLFSNLAILLLSLLFWPRALPYVLAFTFHLAADRMWNHPESFWWPLYGRDQFWVYKPMNTPGEMINVYLDIVYRYPQVWITELIALLTLFWLAYRAKLYRWAGLRQFILSGHLMIGQPIGPHSGHQRSRRTISARSTSSPWSDL
jgi:hypothetical protein